MRLGVTLPHIGELAGPEPLMRVAKHAERLGYDSVWVADRLLYPLEPRTPFPATPDGSFPESFRRVLDPVGTLTLVAAHTSRIGLGTAVLNIPFYNPVVLARQLTTLDVLSHGRLRVGLGQGWSADEFEAAGASAAERGARADEFLQVLRAIWTTDPLEHTGRYFRVPRSVIGPKPVQTPHPPIYLAGFVPAALRRAATLADGWLPAGLPLPTLTQLAGQFRDMTRAVGRDDAALEIVVGVEGALDQLRAELPRLRDLGVSEVFVMLWGEDSGLGPRLDQMSRVRELMA